jgi:hypothetical protein
MATLYVLIFTPPPLSHPQFNRQIEEARELVKYLALTGMSWIHR